MNKTLVLLVFCCAFISPVSAQFLTHELGVHFGTSTIHTDYGERSDFRSNYANNATSLSITHTLHFFNKNQRWNANSGIWDNLALRSELNMVNSASFNHYGPTANSTSILGEQLRAMEGSVSIINIGMQVEYYFKYLRDFLSPHALSKWNPYVLAGVQFSLYSNSLESNLGDWRVNPTILPSKYRAPDALDIGNGTALAGTFGGGTRYKLSKKMDLNAQVNWQYFFSDGIDGLQPDVPENKNNDWLMNFQLGIIYHLNFSKPLAF